MARTKEEIPTFDLDEFITLEAELFADKLREKIDKLPSTKLEVTQAPR